MIVVEAAACIVFEADVWAYFVALEFELELARSGRSVGVACFPRQGPASLAG